MKQGRVTLGKCQILVCHVMTSSPSPFAVFVSSVSQGVNAPRRAGAPCPSAWIFVLQSVWTRPISISNGGDGGTSTGVGSTGATGEAGSETGAGKEASGPGGDTGWGSVA